MTEQENRALNKMAQQLNKFGETLNVLADDLERVKRGLLGDDEFEIVGLIDAHKALRREFNEHVLATSGVSGTEFAALKTEVQAMSRTHGLLGKLTSKLPHVGVATLVFFMTGGDIATVWRFVEGILR